VFENTNGLAADRKNAYLRIWARGIPTVGGNTNLTYGLVPWNNQNGTATSIGNNYIYLD
jgi:hypothetical protein